MGRVFFATSKHDSSGNNMVRENKGADDEEEEMIAQLEDILDVFGNTYMNKHLVYNILELVVVRLVPEVEGSTPGELLGERGVLVGGKGDGNGDGNGEEEQGGGGDGKVRKG
jgi:hypothetical protein